MDLKTETKKIVKSIRMLEGVLKSTPDPQQRGRVKRDIDSLRKKLAEMYPDDDVRQVEQAIADDLLADNGAAPDAAGFSRLEALKGIAVEKISPYKDDQELNEAASILRFFQERIWGVISDQHTKLDFSNSTERDALYRKLDQCNRSYKIFIQTIEDINKTKSSEYGNQLNMMRIKQARVFMYDVNDFFKSTRDFVTALISESDFGGVMITNPGDKIAYADYEEFKTFEGWVVLDALKHMKKFLNEALTIIKLPDIKKM